MRGVSGFIAGAALAAVLASGAAASGPLPGTKTKKDRAAWRALLHWPKACEETWQDTDFGSGINPWTLPGGRRLVEVTCFRGAYQGVAMYYLVSAAHKVTGPLVLRTYIDPGSGRLKASGETRILGLATFTPKTGVLTVFDKFRGPGDCGVYTAAKLTGSRFVTTEVRAKTACDGKPPYDPTRWPKLPLP